MSEKKAPEKKEKEKLVHVTEEQLKAGKEEIMKIVNGQPGAEKLGEMLDKGRKKGRLSSNELMDALEEMDLESEQMDRIYDVLENMGIDTAGEDYLPDLTDGDMPPIEEIEEIPEVIGGYYTARGLDNAFRNVLFNAVNYREALLEQMDIINTELARKQKEFS